jgi:FkbM family methyltransferase
VFWLWRDVETPRFRLFTYEVGYSLCRAANRPPLPLRWLRIKKVKTIFGTFNVRPGTLDVACVSPAFERPDLDHLLALLEERIKAGRSILFLDVGSAVGTYTISVANRLRNLGNLRVLAFEPSHSSYARLQHNIDANDLAGLVESRQIGLWDGSLSCATLQFNPREPSSSGFVTAVVHGTVSEQVALSTLDAQIDSEAVPDILALKIDVEGSEVRVLVGATAAVAAAQEVLLLVEDFVDPRVVDYLESSGWRFDEKLTPYNSFWSFHKDQQQGALET